MFMADLWLAVLCWWNTFAGVPATCDPPSSLDWTILPEFLVLSCENSKLDRRSCPDYHIGIENTMNAVWTFKFWRGGGGVDCDNVVSCKSCQFRIAFRMMNAQRLLDNDKIRIIDFEYLYHNTSAFLQFVSALRLGTCGSTQYCKLVFVFVILARVYPSPASSSNLTPWSFYRTEPSLSFNLLLFFFLWLGSITVMSAR